VKKETYFSWQDLRWLLPLSAGLAAIFALFENGAYALSLLSGGLIFALGLAALTAFWRWAGGGRPLFWTIILALGLRLISAVALQVFIPINGYDNEQQQAGYVFFDAYRRDAQAWDLAQSDELILTAFSKKYHTDQYGGLLALSAGAYRYLSPDAHRPLLIALLGALVAALGVPFFWRAAQFLGGDKLAIPATWIFALYPESILQGSSQMREPFLITFVALALWGFLDWSPPRSPHFQKKWGDAQTGMGAWGLGIGLAGMLLISPAIALVTLIILGGYWQFSREHKRIPWKAILLSGGIFLAALFLLSWGLNRQGVFGTQSPFGVILEWFGGAVKWDVYQLESGSGWVQKLLKTMPAALRLPFVAGYGLAQPVLPATFIEPTTLTWRVIGILRASGWYLLAPFLLYGFVALRKLDAPKARRVWTWFGLACWTWIIIVALRAGGDQWDNPRYRVIFLAIQALFAARAWVLYRERRDVWLPRFLTVEVIFLAFFTQWYASRYYVRFGALSFGAMVAWILVLSGIVLFGGLLWDRKKRRA